MASVDILKEDNQLSVTNPYRSRAPVTNPFQFYGRMDALLQVAESIRSWQPYALSGEPRIGKTSFLYYLVHPDGAKMLRDFRERISKLDDHLFVLIELQRLPVRNASGFWRYLLDRLAEEARKKEVETSEMREAYDSSQESGNDYYQVQKSFESYLKQMKAEQRVLFLFDDFDIVINDFEKTEVVQVTDKLRTLKEALDLNERLNYVILSMDPLVRLLRAREITHPSPFTSILIPMSPLGLLEKDAADELIWKPLQELPASSPTFTEDDFDFIYQLAGRHPYFLKITCFYLFAARIHGAVDYTAVRQEIEEDPQIRWLMDSLWERIKQEEEQGELPLREVLLQIAREQTPARLRAFRELRQRGIVDDSTSPPRVFGDLFRAFLLNLPARPVMSVEFTPLESKLYSHLAGRPGETHSRAELQKVIWGDKVPNSPDALEQLVKRVRTKIEPNPDQPVYLINIRGQGYLLRSDPARLM